MRRYAFGLALLTLAVLGPSVARADDQEIAEQIVQKLQAEKQAGNLKGFSIDLQVEDGTVWLSGRVANEMQHAKALDIARRVAGVKQVVNDLDVADSELAAMPLVRPAVATREASSRNPNAIGSGVAQQSGEPTPARVATAHPLPQTGAPAQLPAGQGGYGYAPVPVYAGSRSQVPLAFAPARQANHEAAGPFHHHGGHGHHGGGGYAMPQGEPMPGNVVPNQGPVPMHMAGSGVGIAPARYDHPSMPCHAWPSYAAYPNYAAVTYPKQYSPSAWPYIGPFYPYPQVPLGWRKVTLEWDDGWWMLDFKERRTMYNH